MSRETGPGSQFRVWLGVTQAQSMYFLYSLALSLLFIVLLPYFLYQAARHGKYAGSFKQRMGFLPSSLRSDGRRTVWVHTVSVGEFLAARPLMALLKTQFPQSRLVVSTTTLTSQQLAQSQSQLFDGVFYFPFDWGFSVRRTLERVQPSAVIILETELWPRFLRECQSRSIVTILVNGRISSRSFGRYRRVLPFIKRVIDDFSLMVFQSESDAERARNLGARASRLRVCGNLKYDFPADGRWDLGVGGETTTKAPGPCEEIVLRFGLSSSRHLIVAGSTAPGEEEMLLKALREVRTHTGLDDTRLLLAPRHPERFDEVARLLAQSGFSFVRRSEIDAGAARARVPVDGASGADVILLDTIGELASLYRFAAVVFVGGSLVPLGGHNVIEPAAFGKPIVVGPHTENFRQVISEFLRANALVQTDSVHLVDEMIRLLANPEQALATGMRARDILLANQGATECTMAAIKEVVKREDWIM